MSGKTLNIVLGVVGIAIAFIIFPIILEGTDDILANENIASYTGLEAIVKISPMIVFVALVFGSGMLVFTGIRNTRNAKKAHRG